MATSKGDLFSFCRYYKGEKECPKDVNSKFWEYERIWVEASKNPKEGSVNSNLLGEYVSNYLNAKLRIFEQFDDTPVTLKALLFDRYTHFGGDADSFKEWYRKEYKKGKD